MKSLPLQREKPQRIGENKLVDREVDAGSGKGRKCAEDVRPHGAPPETFLLQIFDQQGGQQNDADRSCQRCEEGECGRPSPARFAGGEESRDACRQRETLGIGQMKKVSRWKNGGDHRASHGDVASVFEACQAEKEGESRDARQVRNHKQSNGGVSGQPGNRRGQQRKEWEKTNPECVLR
jgi:hypothetical protein